MLEAKDREIVALKAKLKLVDGDGEMNKSMQVSDLVAKNRLLESQLKLMVLERRKAPDGEVAQEKIRTLEATIQTMTKKG